MNRETIAAAAVSCFSKYGPQRTSMADIADEAGISRQSVYRFFDDRSALIRYILDIRIAVAGKVIAKEFSAFRTLEEALVEGSLLSIRIARQDELFRTLVTDSADHSLELFLLNVTPEIRKVMWSYWGPLIDRARAEGAIADHLTDEQIMEWIRHVHTTLTIRGEDEIENQRRMLRNFFVPSILRQAQAPPRPSPGKKNRRA